MREQIHGLPIHNITDGKNFKNYVHLHLLLQFIYSVQFYIKRIETNPQENNCLRHEFLRWRFNSSNNFFLFRFTRAKLIY